MIFRELYSKLSLNGNETDGYTALRDDESFLPTTADFQSVYDEVQFESYRRLGLHIIEEVCAPSSGSLTAWTSRDCWNCAREDCASKPEERASLPNTQTLKILHSTIVELKLIG
jgi:hypothetical protein